MKPAYYAIPALLLAFAGSAAAMRTVKLSGAIETPNGGEAYQGYTGFLSTKSRAQVMQELHDARRRGEIIAGDAYPGPFLYSHARSRADVAAELAAFRAARLSTADDGAFQR